MKTPTHTALAAKLLTHLSGWGFPPGVQQRLGALVVVWGIFEARLEKTLWTLKGEQVAGVRPSTDKTPVSTWIDDLKTQGGQFPPDIQVMFREASAAAFDLMEYRHAIMHGWLVASPSIAIFIRNPRWNGEKRRRPSHDAHVDENLLDMALECAWIVLRFVDAAEAACADPVKLEDLLVMRQDLRRARSNANELRHLTEYANHEKY